MWWLATGASSAGHREDRAPAAGGELAPGPGSWEMSRQRPRGHTGEERRGWLGPGECQVLGRHWAALWAGLPVRPALEAPVERWRNKLRALPGALGWVPVCGSQSSGATQNSSNSEGRPVLVDLKKSGQDVCSAYSTSNPSSYHSSRAAYRLLEDEEMGLYRAKCGGV